MTVYSHWQPLALPEPLPHVYGGSLTEAVAAFGGGYVAVGEVNGGCCDGSFSTDTHGVVWRSTDGLSWSLESRVPVFDLAHVTGLATDGRILLAVGAVYQDSTVSPGNIDPHGAAWTSTDGRTWARVTGLPWFSSVVEAAGAFVASTVGTAGPEIWRSVDGRSWHRVAGPDVLGQGTLVGLVATPVGLVAVGSIGATPESEMAMSWRSPDGLTWTRAPAQASLDGARMTGAAVSGQTIVAIGLRPNAGVAWWSVDGLIWTRSDEAMFGVTGTGIDAVVAGTRGFLATGVAEDGSALPGYPVWVSSDGRRWQLIDPPLSGNGPAIRCAVDRGPGLTVFGDGFDAQAGREVSSAWDVR